MRTLFRLFQLFYLARMLRRYGALRALEGMPFVPPAMISFLRVATFFVLRQPDLPQSGGERLALALSHMGPAYIKLGQTLAMRPDVVGAPIAEGLATLQDRLPPFDTKLAKKQIELELGAKVEEIYAEFDETPVAAASIAQVHKAVTADGKKVAVKILRPDVSGRFIADIDLFEWIAKIGERSSNDARRLRLVDVVAKVRETSMKEMDLRLEAAASAELKDNMTGETGYRIPEIDWQRTGRRVMTLEWVDGIRISDRQALIDAGFDLTELSERVVQTFLRQATRDGFFHADLHQGNLLVQKDGTIVAIDFGIMGRLSINDRRYLAEILHGFHTRNYRRVAEVHFDAGYVPKDQDIDEFAQALRAIADPIMGLPLEQVSAGKLLAQLFATTDRFNMQTQPQLVLLQRTMVMAEGMALHLNPAANMWDISRPTIEAWMRDYLSPDARIMNAVKELPHMLSRLPHFFDRLANFDMPQLQQQPAPVEYKAPRFMWIWPLITGFLLGGFAVGMMIGH